MKVNIVPTKYEPDSLESHITFEMVDINKWAIRRMRERYTHDGEWIYEPMPSSRDEEFYHATQWAFDEGMVVYKKLLKDNNA